MASNLDNSELSHDATLIGENDALVGKQIGKYSVLARIARGGTATVYRGLDTVLQREVAIKILHEHLETRPEIVERFKTEAKVVAQLRHGNVVTVYDFFEFDGRVALVVEYMPGITLSALVKENDRLPEDYVLMIGHELLQGLRAAHQRGIIHRDIKPANVLVHAELGIKLSDFGLAKMSNQEDGHTKTGVFVGTPSFSSPEQIEGRPLDHRTDIFSVGLVLYLLATRSHAFKNHGDSTTTVWFKIVRGTFDPVRKKNPDLSMEFEKILNKALEVDANKRYPTAEAMAMDLENLLKTRGLFPYTQQLKTFLTNPRAVVLVSRRSRKILNKSTLVAAGLAVVLVCMLAGFFKWNSSTLPPPAPTPPPMIGRIDDKPEPKIEAPAPVKVEVKPEVKTEPKPAESKADVKTEAPVEVAVVPKKKIVIVPVKLKAPLLESAILLKSPAFLVTSPGDSEPGYRIEWQGAAKLLVSKEKDFSNPAIDSETVDNSWVFADVPTGMLYWKGGNSTGTIESATPEALHAKIKSQRGQLVVAAAFGDVDLEINPWQQDIKLIWQNGPDASAYRVELSSDPAFKQILFSATEFNKSTLIERFWDKDQTVYWRISYIDEAKNVFLVDPPHRVSLKLKGAARSFEVVQPRPHDKVGSSLEVIAGSSQPVRCTGISPHHSIESWTALKESPNKSNWSIQMSLSKGTKWVACESMIEDRQNLWIIPVSVQ